MAVLVSVFDMVPVKPKAGAHAQIEQSLTALRPKVAESQRRVAPMSESEPMTIETARAEQSNDQKVLYLSPDEARRRTFAILQRQMSVVARPGSAKCRTLMHRLADAYSRSTLRSGNVRPIMAGIDDEAMTMLRARCAICPERCERPVE